jgi:hypothetical protein
MGNNGSKDLQRQSKKDKMSEEKMDVASTSEGKNCKFIHDRRN